MTDNGAMSFTEGSEPIKLTEVGGSEETPRESIIKFLYGSSSYKGYWFGDIPPGKPSFWWRNLLREEIDSMLKEERNKAIDECRHEIALWLTEPEKLGSELMERITALKSDSK